MDLFEAAKEGDIGIIKSLVESGADINEIRTFDSMVWTFCPIYVACKFRQIDAVTELIGLGCRLDFTGTRVINPISGLAYERDEQYQNTRDIGILDILITNGCPVSSHMNPDITFTFVNRTLINQAVITENFLLAKKLVDYGSEINEETFDWILGQGDDDFINHFIGHGCDINAKDRKGKTRLMNHNINWNTTIIRKLLRHGADPNICDKNGYSVLNSDKYLDNSTKSFIKMCLKELGKN